MATFVTDTFTDASGTAITAHVGELGATWAYNTANAASFVISDANRCRPNSTGNGYAYASGTPASADYDVTAVVRKFSSVGTATNIGLVARSSTGAATFYYAQYNDGAAQWQLGKLVSGGNTALGTGFSQALTLNTDYTLTLRVQGSSISLYVDGVLRVGPATDSTITAAGRAGIKCGGNTTTASNTTGYHLDTFGVADIPGGGSTGAASDSVSVSDSAAGVSRSRSAADSVSVSDAASTPVGTVTTLLVDFHAPLGASDTIVSDPVDLGSAGQTASVTSSASPVGATGTLSVEDSADGVTWATVGATVPSSTFGSTQVATATGTVRRYARVRYVNGSTAMTAFDLEGSASTGATFPITTILDAFNRSDGTLGSQWAAPLYPGDAEPSISTNRIVGSASYASAYWNPINFANVAAFVETPVVDTGHALYLYARCQGAGTSGFQGYYAWVTAAGTMQLGKITTGLVDTTLGGAIAVSRGAGDAYGIVVNGSIIESWHRASGSWSRVAQVTDTSITGAGRMGFEVEGTTWRLDNFGGGAIGVTTSARTSSDTVTASDVATRLRTGPRAITDTTAVADAAARVMSRPRVAVDTVTLADQAATPTDPVRYRWLGDQFDSFATITKHTTTVTLTTHRTTALISTHRTTGGSG